MKPVQNPSAKPSKVYFTDFHATPSETLPQKLHRLMKRAGFEEIDFTDRYAAIKIHFGELGNLAYLRPQYAKVVADYVRELGGKAFLTDCNTLYVGSRKNALDHMDTAYLNGFSPLQTGCHVIIADGLKGTDEALVPINLPLVKEAKIGQAIMDADIVISLSHFKGHEEAGFGGALKNLGMGSGSRSGKMEQHWEGKPVVEPELCIGCGSCVQHLRARRPRARKRQGAYRPRKVRRLRPLPGHLPQGRHRAQRGKFDQHPLLQDRGVCLRGGEGPPVLPHLADLRRLALLRLPCRERRSHHPGYRHAGLL